MRHYIVFYVKKDIYDVYKGNGYILFQTLKNLHDLNKKNIKFGKSLYEQLCIPFDLSIINKYLFHKYTLLIRKNDNYWFINSYSGEKTLVKLKRTRIIINTNVEKPEILKVLEFYTYRLLVCNFELNDFFWLSYKRDLSKVPF